MKKSNIENIKVVADAENAQPHFCCSHIIFSILDFFTVLFFGCRRKGLNCYLIMGSRGIRSGVFCLLLRCIFQKIFKSCKTSYLENLENILSAYFQGIFYAATTFTFSILAVFYFRLLVSKLNC